MPFDEITAMNGGIHCATFLIRHRLRQSTHLHTTTLLYLNHHKCSRRVQIIRLMHSITMRMCLLYQYPYPFIAHPQLLPFLVNYPSQITSSSSEHCKAASQTSSISNQNEPFLHFRKVSSPQKLHSTELDVFNEQIPQSGVEADRNLNATADRGVNDQDN
ncbi:MAG: hypothetical protein EZS28_052791, partial [Streblomastix strix]